MTAPCTRFEDEGLAKLKAAEPLDPHFSECPDCVRARERYQAQVLGQRGRGPVARPTPWWRWGAIAAPALAAAVLVAVYVRPAEAPLEIDQSVERAIGNRTGPDSAAPGDVLKLTASGGRTGHQEIRVYRGDTTLVLRCPPVGAPACTRKGDVLEVHYPMPSAGKYQGILLTFDRELPEPSGNYDADYRQADRNGAHLVPFRPINAR